MNPENPLAHYQVTHTGVIKVATEGGKWKSLGIGKISYGVESMDYFDEVGEPIEYPELPEVPTTTNKKPWFLGWDGSSSGNETIVGIEQPAPEPEPEPDPYPHITELSKLAQKIHDEKAAKAVEEQTVSGGVPWDQPGADPLADIKKAMVKAKNAQTKLSGTWLTIEQMTAWLEALDVKLPSGTYLAWDGSKSGPEATVAAPWTHDHTKPLLTIEQRKKWLEYLGWQEEAVDTAPTSENAENPATAPCRVFWNSHGCDKPRIHVLPGHPAGPDHQCGWSPQDTITPCSKVDTDGQLWAWIYETGTWVLAAPPELHGEDWTG